jgi:hypothetical protein
LRYQGNAKLQNICLEVLLPFNTEGVVNRQRVFSLVQSSEIRALHSTRMNLAIVGKDSNRVIGGLNGFRRCRPLIGEFSAVTGASAIS